MWLEEFMADAETIQQTSSGPPVSAPSTTTGGSPAPSVASAALTPASSIAGHLATMSVHSGHQHAQLLQLASAVTSAPQTPCQSDLASSRMSDDVAW